MHAELAAVPSSLYQVTRANRVIAVVMQPVRAMKMSLPLLLILIVLCGGCFDGAQKGKFAVTRSAEVPLANYPGKLVSLSGHALSSDYQSVAMNVPLLHVLVVCPGLKVSGSGSKASDGTFLSTRKLTWFTGPRDVTVEFSWDRASDTVDVGGKIFDRKDGEILVAVRNSDGRITTLQVASIDANVSNEEVLRHVKKELTGKQLVADVNLLRLAAP